ncbi:hypothetical protein [Amycolatopsis sp. CA-230715]|uniref:hypothetical protein n=1 Tax=Amycolatopsis sp. CA-230715 TaxID=2745196 RepID=UPI001C01767F|nr:hypothetical protein [Amycolatopsis sp. CA-230715]
MNDVQRTRREAFRGQAGGCDIVDAAAPSAVFNPEGLLVTIDVRTLVELVDPLRADPWGVGSISPEQVNAAFREGRLRRDNPAHNVKAVATSDAHAERIAWLIRHGWDRDIDVVQIDVNMHGGIAVNDGNHRVYALAFVGADGPITIDLSGFLDVAETVLDITIPLPVNP